MVPNQDTCTRVLYPANISPEQIVHRIVPTIQAPAIQQPVLRYVPNIAVGLIIELTSRLNTSPRILLFNMLAETDFRNQLFSDMVTWASDFLYLELQNTRMPEPNQNMYTYIVNMTIDVFSIRLMETYQTIVFVDHNEGNRLNNLKGEIHRIMDMISRMNSGRNYSNSIGYSTGPYVDYSVPPIPPVHDSRSYGPYGPNRTQPMVQNHNQGPMLNTGSWIRSNSNTAEVSTLSSGIRPVNTVLADIDKYEAYNKANMPVPDRVIQQNTVMPNPVVSPIPASNLSTIPKLPIRIATYRGEQAVNRDSHKVLEYFGSVQEESKPTPVLDMDLEEVTISIRQDTNTIYELVTLFKQTLSTEPVIFRTAGEIKDSYYSSENLNPHFASLRSCIDFKSVIRTLSNIPNQVYKLGNQLHYDAIGAVGSINNKLTDYFNNFVYYQLGADTVIESLITDYNSWLNNELANTDWLIQNNAIQHLREWERAFLSEYFNDSLDKESGVLQFRKKYIGISLPDLDETFLKVSNRDRVIISKETTPSLYTLLVSSFKESRIGDCDLVPHILMTRDDIAYVVNRDIENNFCIKELIPRFRNPAM